MPNTEALLRVFENQLAVLLGKAPGSIETGALAKLPALPQSPATGLPVALLQRRPDLRAASLRIIAADYQVAVAIGNQYPRLSLSGDAGFGASQIGDLFSNWLWNLIGNLTAPLLDGGARKGEVMRSQATFEERVLNYESAFLAALQEVEDALINEQKTGEFIARLETQLDLARQGLDAGQARYLRGVGDFLTVLTQTQSVQRIERSLISARATRINQRINLYQALGGGWTGDLDENLFLPK